MSFVKSGVLAAAITCIVSSVSTANAIELVVWEDAGKGIGIKKAASDFTSATGVAVKVVEFRYIYALERLRLDGPAGTGPDVLLLPNDALGSAVAQGMITPVYMTPKEKSTYVDKALDAATYNGACYMFPKSIETLAVFYNKALLPKPLKTLDDYYIYSLKMRDSEQYGLLAKFDDLYYTYGVMAPYGAYIFNTAKKNSDSKDTYDVSDIGLANEGAIQGAMELKKFYDKDLFPSVIEGRGALNNIIKLFKNGKASAAILGSFDLMSIRKSKIDFGVAPLPYLENGKQMTSFLGVRGYAISHWTNKYDLAVKFAKFITQDKYSVGRYPLTLELPATKDSLKDPLIANDPYAKPFVEQYANAQLMPANPEMSQVWFPYEEALYNIFKKKADLNETLVKTVELLKTRIEDNSIKKLDRID